VSPRPSRLARLRLLRETVRRRPALARVYRLVVGIIGWAIVLLGLLLVPLPGPGWALVFVGLAVLASEFHWARRIQQAGKRVFDRCSGWLRRQSRTVRAALGSAFVVLAGVALAGYTAWRGVPEWLPFIG
jgi:uncharacterized protein (TIGR02611 family)